MIRLTINDTTSEYAYFRQGEIPLGYTDVNTVPNILTFHYTTGEDVIVQTNAIRSALIDLGGDEFSGFDLLTSTQKEQMLPLKIGSTNQRLALLSNDRSELTDVNARSEYSARDARCYRMLKAKESIIIYVGIGAASQILFEINGFKDKYEDDGLMGTIAGDPVAGIADYVNSTTGTQFENNGMREKTFPVAGGLTIDQLCDLILYDYLIRGY